MRIGETARIDRAVSGFSGALKVGYQPAADLGAWDLSLVLVTPPTYRLKAKVKASSAYWLSQRPFTLVLDLGAQTWAWAEIEIDLEAVPGFAIARVSGRPAITRK